MTYLIIFLYILFLVYYYDYLGHTRNKKWAFWSVMIIFILLSGLRYHIGIDTFQYRMTWDRYPDITNFKWSDIEAFRRNPQVERFHAGWIIYVMILQFFSKSFIFLQFTNAFLINFAVFRIIRKYSNHIFTTVLIYAGTFTFIEYNFELMREAVAVSIFLLWGFDAFVKRQWTKYYLTVLLAYTIHPSSLMMFAFPLIRNLNWSLRQYILYLIVPSFLIGLAGKIFLGNVINVILGGNSYISEYYEEAGKHSTNINYFLMYAFKPTVMLVLYACFKKYVTLPKFYEATYFFTIFFLYIGGLIYTAGRFTSYIIIIDYILLADIIWSLMKKWRGVYVAVILLIAMYIPNLYQYWGYPMSLACHYPYRSVLIDNPSANQKKLDSKFKYVKD